MQAAGDVPEQLDPMRAAIFCPLCGRDRTAGPIPDRANWELNPDVNSGYRVSSPIAVGRNPGDAATGWLAAPAAAGTTEVVVAATAGRQEKVTAGC